MKDEDRYECDNCGKPIKGTLYNVVSEKLSLCGKCYWERD
jgi:ribosome-binding protein aMBF1 (putative translation factor)